MRKISFKILFPFRMKSKFALLYYLIIFSLCFALELDYSVSSLWKDATGAATEIDFGFAEKIKIKNEIAEPNFRFSSVKSSLDYLSGNVFFGDMGFKFENPRFLSQANIIFPSIEDLYVDVDGKHFVFQETIIGIGFYQNFGVKFHDTKILSYFSYLSLPEVDGKYYWYNGKLGIPEFSDFGLSFENAKHQFNINYGTVEISGQNDESLDLGQIQGKNIFAQYRFLFNTRNCKFSSSVGYGKLFGDIKLTLNENNQQYLVFPYVYYNSVGDFFGRYFSVGLDFNYENKRFNICIDSESIFVFEQKGDIKTEWEYKKNMFFDGKSGLENYSLDFFDNKGLVIVDVNGDWKINISKLRCKLNFGKTFVIPITFDSSENESSVENDMSSENTTGTMSEKTNTDMIKTWLCSGIRIGLVIEY